MNEKYDSIKRMKELMKEKGLTHVFLENVLPSGSIGTSPTLDTTLKILKTTRSS